jgi:hypothetical protein
MRILDAEAPPAEHHDSGHWEQHTGQLRGELPRRLVETRCQRGGKPWCGGHTDEGEGTDGNEEQTEHGVGQCASSRLITGAEQPAVDRDEGRRQGPFAQQIAHRIRYAERGVVGVGRGARSEEIGKRRIAQETDDAADEDAGPDDERCASARALAHARVLTTTRGRP